MAEDTSDDTTFVRMLADSHATLGKRPAINWKTDSYLRFATADRDFSNWNELARIDSVGNFGIGSNDPQARLHIISPSDDNYLVLQNATKTNKFRIRGSGAQNKSAYLSQNYDYSAATRDNASYGTAAIDIHSDSDNTNSIRFYTGTNAEAAPTEKMRINEDGFVGIGTDNPDAPLQILGNITHASEDIQLDLSDNTAPNTMGAGGGVVFSGYHSTALPTNFARYAAIRGAKENGIDGNYAGYLEFFTRSYPGSTFTSRMRIASDGNVGIGTTNPDKLLTLFGDNPEITIDTPDGNDTLYIGLSGGGALETGARAAHIVAYGNEYPVANYKGQLLLSAGDVAPVSDVRDGAIVFRTAGSTNPKMMLNYDGHVGIGTDDPDTTLHIAGSIKITGGVPGAGKVLTTVDGTGLASWETVAGATDSDWLEAAASDSLFRLDTGGDTIVTITDDGYMGIGTTSPASSIHILNNSPGLGLTPPIWTDDMVIESGTGAVNGTGISIYAQDDVGSHITFGSPSSESYAAVKGSYNYHGIPTMEFRVGTIQNDDPKMLIDSLGQVGIGTTEPEQKFHIYSEGDADGGAVMVLEQDNTPTSASAIYLAKTFRDANLHSKFFGQAARGDKATPESVINGDFLAEFGGYGYESTADNYDGGARIVFSVDSLSKVPTG